MGLLILRILWSLALLLAPLDFKPRSEGKKPTQTVSFHTNAAVTPSSA